MFEKFVKFLEKVAEMLVDCMAYLPEVRQAESIYRLPAFNGEQRIGKRGGL